MNKFIPIAIALLLVGLNLGVAASSRSLVGALVRVHGVREGAKPVVVECYASRSAWERDEPSFRRAAEPHEGVFEARFEGLPSGEYVFVAFEDRNDNGELDWNLFGVPTEPVGISRPHEDTELGFAEHAVTVGEAPLTLDITLE